MEDLGFIETLVIGGGVVGLACAARLADEGFDTMLLERNLKLAEETSSRNSGVIHSGIYYPTGSEKATLCIEGKRLLGEFCLTNNIPFKQTGKLIVTSELEEAERLNKLMALGQANGVEGLTFVGQSQICDKEPEIVSPLGIYSPSSGILDVPQLAVSLSGQAETNGCQIALGVCVKKVIIEGKNLLVLVEGIKNEEFKLRCRFLVNAAGHGALDLHQSLTGVGAFQKLPFAKGNYFKVHARNWSIKTLVYPLPVPGGLGTHLTVDIGGQLKIGPNVEKVQKFDYLVNPDAQSVMVADVSKFWPEIKDRQVSPDYVGIRPKIYDSDGQQIQDFIFEQSSHEDSQVISLLGIESPGVTCCLSIANRVLDMIST